MKMRLALGASPRGSARADQPPQRPAPRGAMPPAGDPARRGNAEGRRPGRATASLRGSRATRTQTGCKASFKYAGSSDEIGHPRCAPAAATTCPRPPAMRRTADRLEARRRRSTSPRSPTGRTSSAPSSRPPNNTVGGKHYGVSLALGPERARLEPGQVHDAPTSWSAIYSRANSGKITVPDNPIQIADAALYLSKTKPSLGIKDPYELTSSQLAAAVDLPQAAAPARQEVLGARERRDRRVHERRRHDPARAWPLVPATLIAPRGQGQVDDPEGRRDGLGPTRGWSARRRPIRTARCSG